MCSLWGTNLLCIHVHVHYKSNRLQRSATMAWTCSSNGRNEVWFCEQTAACGRGDLRRELHNKMEYNGRLSVRLIRQVRRTCVGLEVHLHITSRCCSIWTLEPRATDRVLGGTGLDTRQGRESFFYSKTSRPALEPPSLHSMGTGALRRTGHEATTHLHLLSTLTFRHRASCVLGQAFHYSPENAFYIFNQQIYFIIWYLLDRASLI